MRLSSLGEERSKKTISKTGVIVGKTRGAGYYVLLDGNVTKSILHCTYIEPVSDQAARPT
ncbi:hypothetical protein [Afipia sp. P52-10]|uniref:hypothetical protein n=1 Tax=Afipia sp. P52-10 TaxID=1429916 RepID=UPI0012687E2F|nr:hypothetical protein [Afipia sp. P52-10]